MLRPNAHHDHEIFSKHPPLPSEETRMNFPLPHLGDTSPDLLTLQMLAKITFVFGLYFLFIRMTGLTDAGLASFVANLFAVIYGVAFAIKLFTPERGESEWVIWVIALAVLILVLHWLFPVSFITPNWGEASRTSMIEPMLQLVILLLLLISVVAPSVKNVLLRKTRGQLFMGCAATLVGGQLSAWSYSPQSEFSAWANLAALLIVAWMVSAAMADQYVRFQIATSPALNFGEEGFSHGLARYLPLYQGLLGILILVAAVWFGNFVFLNQFGKDAAALYGLGAAAAFLLAACVIQSLFQGQSPFASFVEAWNATTFFLTYNLQQNDNPHSYQCSLWFRAPIVRFLTIGLGVTSVGLPLFHLSGVQTPISEKDKRTPVPAIWNKLLPHGHPEMVKAVARPSQGIDAYSQIAQELVEKGDVLPAGRKDISIAVLLRSVALFLLGGPLGFLLLLAAVQGNYLAWVRNKLTTLENEPFDR